MTSIQVKRFTDVSSSKLKELFFKYPYHRNHQIRGIPSESIVQLCLFNLGKWLKDERNRLLVAYEGDEMVGCASIRFMDWDTNHFGIKMANMENLFAVGDEKLRNMAVDLLIEHAEDECRSIGIEHLSTKIYPADNVASFALQRNGHRLMDTRVTFTVNLKYQKPSEPPLKGICRLADPKRDLDVFKKLAYVCFKDGWDRFHNDPAFSKEKADQVYTNWAANSLAVYGHTCFIAEVDGEPAGFITVSIDDYANKFFPFKVSVINLMVTLPKFQGRGVAKSIATESINYMHKELGMDIVRSEAQITNWASVHAVRHAGMRLDGSVYAFSKDLRKGQ